MNHSLGEVATLAMRAARGAGFDWGKVEETGACARWLAQFKLPGLQVLVRHLSRCVGDSATGSDPLDVGCRMTDAGPARFRDHTLTNMAAPLLLLPFVARGAAHLQTCVELRWGETGLTTDGRCISLHGKKGDVSADGADHVTVRRCAARELDHAPQRRVELDPDTLAGFRALAERSYAPATELSRQRGAGDGG